jgi:hypothetical protein
MVVVLSNSHAQYTHLLCGSTRKCPALETGSQRAELISQGSPLQALQGVLVTCLELDDEYLWVGTADGRLQAYAHQSSDLPLALQSKPDLEWNVGSAILSLSLSSEMGHGVVSTVKGTVELFSMEDDDAMLAQWSPYSKVRQSSNCYILSCSLVPYKDERGGYALVCGCNDGSILHAAS